jgi:hypothetical protein
MDLQFLNPQQFRDEYQRNNKAKGRKNLRCFPACREHGHVDTGYCGRPIMASLKYDPNQVRDLDIISFAEFRPYDRNTGHQVALGQVYQLSDIVRFSRGASGTGQNAEEKALNPWFPGSVIDTESQVEENWVRTTFAFNQTNQGWHYAWQSHRMTRDTKHCLHVFVLAGSKSNGAFTVVSDIISPPFQIYCRRKREKSEEECQLVSRDVNSSCSQQLPQNSNSQNVVPRMITPPRMFDILGSQPEPKCPSPPSFIQSNKKLKAEHHGIHSQTSLSQNSHQTHINMLSALTRAANDKVTPTSLEFSCWASHSMYHPTLNVLAKNHFLNQASTTAGLLDFHRTTGFVNCVPPPRETQNDASVANIEYAALCALTSLARGKR